MEKMCKQVLWLTTKLHMQFPEEPAKKQQQETKQTEQRV